MLKFEKKKGGETVVSNHGIDLRNEWEETFTDFALSRSLNIIETASIKKCPPEIKGNFPTWTINYIKYILTN